MFQSQVLKGALAALAFVETILAATTNQTDKLAYPEFESAMLLAGGYNWMAYPVLSGSGYELVLFRIIGDEIGSNLVDTRGPVLLQAGMFSDTLDWLDGYDSELMAVPL